MSEQFTNGYALLIGVDENNVAKWGLPDVAKDIAALAKVFTHLERCAYPADNVKVLAGQEATRQGILDGLEWLQERVEADGSGNATAVVYYSGHGWRDKSAEPAEFYFVPYDVRQGKIRSRALRAVDFAEAVGELKPRRLLVVLDCCHAAGMGVKDVLPLPAGYVGAAIAPSLLMEGEEVSVGPGAKGAKGFEELAQGKGRAVLSSSTGEQSSYIRKDRKMSVFTYHLIEALTGHAQPQEEATEVLVSDVMSHVWRRVPESVKADWNEVQEPDYQVSGNFPIALLLGGKGLSKGQPAPDPLGEIVGEETMEVRRRVDTGGGAYMEGGVDTEGGNFIGRDKIVHGDEVHGDKVGGDKVGGDKITVGDITSSTGVAIGRGAQATVTTGIPGQDLDRLFAPLMNVLREAPPEKRDEAIEKAEALKNEVAKSKDADDSRMAKLLDGLVELVPGAVSALVSAFASPILGGIAGPVTKFVLDKIQRK